MAGVKACPGASPSSVYYAFDPNMNYQYHAFGVPGLGFKRNLAEDLVITPYASLLALPFHPRRSPRTSNALPSWRAGRIWPL